MDENIFVDKIDKVVLNDELIKFFNKNSNKVTKNDIRLTIRTSLKKNNLVVYERIVDRRTNKAKTHMYKLSDKDIEVMTKILYNKFLSNRDKILALIHTISAVEIKKNMDKILKDEMIFTKNMKNKVKSIFEKEWVSFESNELKKIKFMYDESVKEHKKPFVRTWNAFKEFNNTDIISFDISYEDLRLDNYKIKATKDDIKITSNLVDIVIRKDNETSYIIEMERNKDFDKKVNFTISSIQGISKSLESYEKSRKYFDETIEKTSRMFLKDDFYKFRDFMDTFSEFQCTKLTYIPQTRCIKIGQEDISLELEESVIYKKIDDSINSIAEEIKGEFKESLSEMRKIERVKEYDRIVELVARESCLTMSDYIDILKGANNKRVREERFFNIKGYGSLKNMTKAEIKECIYETIRLDYVDLNDDYDFILSCGEEGLFASDDYREYKECSERKVPESKRSSNYKEYSSIDDGEKYTSRDFGIEKICSLKKLKQNLDEGYSAIKLRAVLTSAKENIKEIESSDFKNLFKIIRGNRAKYKRVEKEFISFVVNKTNPNLVPILMLEESMGSDTNKDVLSKIIEGLKNKKA